MSSEILSKLVDLSFVMVPMALFLGVFFFLEKRKNQKEQKN